MTEEEKKEFEEFLQWKAEKKKKEEEAKALEEAKLKQQKEEEEKKQVSSNVSLTTNDDHTYTAKNTDAKAVYNEVSYSFEKVVGIGIIVFLIVIFMISKCAAESSNKQNTEETTPEQLALKKQQDSIAKVKAAEYAEEKHRQDSIKRAERVELLKHTIRIKKAYISSPNSAGGVDATIVFKNVSNKTIKYFRWSGYPINAVGDPVSCTIRDYCESGGTATGPIKPGVTYGNGRYWECLWYNYSAKKLILTGVEIEYMDGSSINISKNELKYVR